MYFYIYSNSYNKFTAEGYLANFFGLTVVAFAIIVSYIITNPNLRRQSSPDEEHVQLTQ